MINIQKKQTLHTVFFEKYKISGDKMKASRREYTKDQHKFFTAHEKIYTQALNDVLELYPGHVKNSVLLHDDNLNEYFLSLN